MLSDSAIRRLPKVQLHCHLEGTLRAATFRDLAGLHGVDVGWRATVPLEETYDFATFAEFLLLFAAVCKVLRSPEDFARLARDFVDDAIAQGVAYAELFVSPSVWTYFHPHLDVREVITAMRHVFDATRRDNGLEIALIADLTRNFGAERARDTARAAIALQDLGVIGIGLGGDEVNYPPHIFVDAFEEARRAGLRCVVHAGEAAGAASIRSALDHLGAERIGHGVRALDDDALVEELARSRVPLEICPTSNALTGAVASDAAHPIGELDRRGVVCVIDADDPALFGTTLCDEYALIADTLGHEALLRFARNAIEASFAPENAKAVLRARLAAFEALEAEAVSTESAGRRRTP